MSGGHFNGNGYIYYQVNQFADELENEIENNHRGDERNYNYAPNFNEETLAVLREQLPLFRRMAQIMKEIDYLYSGDHGEDNFLKLLKNINGEA